MLGIMIPEKVFQKILVLGAGWQVQQVDYVEQASQVLIRIEETPRCGRARLVRIARARRWAATITRPNGGGGISMCASYSRNSSAHCRAAGARNARRFTPCGRRGRVVRAG
jgi:hypothetical protein